ncbi:transglutaminase domain-containing protein [Streptomyces californicus]|uniref:transglutaminase domain-containing protein n=1 Tax=Streptomyces californicus TaxID=67351 RepID=UPI003692E9BC
MWPPCSTPSCEGSRTTEVAPEGIEVVSDEGVPVQVSRRESSEEGRVRLYEQVRAVPYATDGAHDGESLLVVGRGDCLAKAGYLLAGLRAQGLVARPVRWLYLLPPRPDEVYGLRSREDVHTAVEVWLAGRWVMVDATFDPPLAAAGFTVGQWDGATGTAPACEPAGPLWRPGEGPPPMPRGHGTGPDPGGPAYRTAFNRWLRDVRAAGEA